jgi:hypothetical protein
MNQTGAVELLRCWKDRWEERNLVATMTAFVVALVVGAAILVQEYSAPTVFASLQR